MRVLTTAPLEDPREARTLFPKLEAIGYDGAYTFEAKHDPFLPLATAAEHTSHLQLGTAIAIAFGRNPMNLANAGYGLQSLSGGRFTLGLGSQVRPHIEKRFGMPWSRPAARMRELVLAVRAIWARWEGTQELDFRGEFYTHTLMIPAFDPGPNPFGPPPIHVAGFGPRMTEVAAEVGDGFIAHPFTTRRSLLELTLPALERGAARAGKQPGEVDVVCATMVVAADEPGELDRILAATRKHLAFYGSTPAYRSTLEVEGFGHLHPELNRMSKRGEWDAMAQRVPDELVDRMAVVGRRGEIAAKLRARLEGIADAVSLTNNRCPDPEHWSDVVADLRRDPER